MADALATAWRRLADIPAGKELPWLYGTARRVLANRRRGVTRYLRVQRRLAAEPVASATPADYDEVLAALGRLPAQDQEVLRLAAWEDLAPADIATVLGCTSNAAALRLSRARQRLRAILTEPVTARTQARTENDDV